MFGTIAHLKVKPGNEQELLALFQRSEESSRATPGAIGEYIYRLENAPHEYMLVAIFTDRKSYFANAARPATDLIYQELRALLMADPEWHDGEIVASASYASVGI